MSIIKQRNEKHDKRQMAGTRFWKYSFRFPRRRQKIDYSGLLIGPILFVVTFVFVTKQINPTIRVTVHDLFVMSLFGLVEGYFMSWYTGGRVYNTFIGAILFGIAFFGCRVLF